MQPPLNASQASSVQGLLSLQKAGFSSPQSWHVAGHPSRPGAGPASQDSPFWVSQFPHVSA